MSICPRVGGLAQCLDRARLTNFYQDSKRQSAESARARCRWSAAWPTRPSTRCATASRPLLTGGMLFEELGFRYIGPIDGHDLPTLRRWLRDVKDQRGPVLLHVLTEKGHGVPQASEDPVTYHTPPVFEKVGPERTILSLKRGGSKAYTDAASAAIYQAHEGRQPDVAVITAAMCQGNKLEKVRERVSRPLLRRRHLRIARRRLRRRAWPRPACGRSSAIYSTFLQRAFDQIFQEVALQNLPVTFCLDRAGLTGPGRPDAPRRLRHRLHAAVPELRRHGPRRRAGRGADAAVRLEPHGPGVACAIPRRTWRSVERGVGPDRAGPGRGPRMGDDGMLVAYGTCSRPASRRPSGCGRKAWTSASSTPASPSRSTSKHCCGPWSSCRWS